MGDEPSQPELLRHAAWMSSPSAAIVLDPQGRLVLSNHRAAELFGLTDHDVGRLVPDLLVQDRPIDLRAHVEQAQRQREAVWIRDVRRGETLALDVQVLPLVDESGATLGVAVLADDVTLRRRLQQDLTDANRRLAVAYGELQDTNDELQSTVEELRSVIEELDLSMSSGVAVVDADLRVLAWNGRAEELWGMRSDEAVGELLVDLDIGLPVEQLRQPISTQLADPAGQSTMQVLVAVDRSGRSCQVEVTLTRLVDQGAGSPAAMLVMDVVGSSG